MTVTSMAARKEASMMAAVTQGRRVVLVVTRSNIHGR
jgi:hypothetical protein